MLNSNLKFNVKPQLAFNNKLRVKESMDLPGKIGILTENEWTSLYLPHCIMSSSKISF